MKTKEINAIFLNEARAVFKEVYGGGREEKCREHFSFAEDVMSKEQLLNDQKLCDSVEYF